MFETMASKAKALLVREHVIVPAYDRVACEAV
jgi:hypothetical protein